LCPPTLIPFRKTTSATDVPLAILAGSNDSITAVSSPPASKGARNPPGSISTWGRRFRALMGTSRSTAPGAPLLMPSVRAAPADTASLMRALAVLLVAVSFGCGSEVPAPLQAVAAQKPASTEVASADGRSDCDNPNPTVFEVDARPYGLSIVRWTELLWDYIYAVPFDVNPFFDPTGADCAVDQWGPVWFLPSIPGAALGYNVVRNCTIPRDRAVLFQLATALNDYPCPEPPPFQPAPGQSLYDFLLEGIAPVIDNEPPFTVTLDGVEIVNPRNYRFTSPDIFFIDGNLSLQATFDNCITGKPQPAVSDGFYFMFKPLPPGEHTIAAVGQNRQTGPTMTLTEHLTIR
jgi:hypothetical protein